MENKSSPKDKFQLRAYLESLDLRNRSSLKEMEKEIVSNVERVMMPYVLGERGKPLQDYYSPCLNLINDAVKKRDFNNDFPLALEFLITSLEWE